MQGIEDQTSIFIVEDRLCLIEINPLMLRLIMNVLPWVPYEG